MRNLLRRSEEPAALCDVLGDSGRRARDRDSGGEQRAGLGRRPCLGETDPCRARGTHAPIRRRGPDVSIVRARLQPYTLPLRDAWPSADGNVNDRRGWILALEDGSGRVGLGDAAPFPGFGLETHASAGAGLKLAMARLVGMSRDGFAAVIADLPNL